MRLVGKPGNGGIVFSPDHDVRSYVTGGIRHEFVCNEHRFVSREAAVRNPRKIHNHASPSFVWPVSNMQHNHPYASSSTMPHPNSGDYVVSWLDALSVQGAGWLPEFYSDPPRPSHYASDTRTFVQHTFDPFVPSFHQEPSTVHHHHHYQSHLGVPGTHSNLPATPVYRHSAYAPIASHHHRDPSPVFYEEQSPPLPLYQSFPDFSFGDADSVPSISSASSVTDTESVSASESRRRQKSKIALAADQPLTVDGKPRERVFVACDRCRLRKLRCDGGHPSCFNCERVADQGVFCCYESAPRRRGQDKAPRIRSPVGQRKPRRPAVRKTRSARMS